MAYDKVGMTVVRRHPHYPDRVGTVVKVARRYATVEFPYGDVSTSVLTELYDKETGEERRTAQSTGWSASIATPEEWAAVDRRGHLVDALRKAGLEVTGRARLTLEQLEAVAETLNIKLT